MTVRNATELLKLIENTLGWVPPYDDDKTPLWRARTIHAGRINKKIAENPTLYTWHNLELAVELLRRRREMIRGPLVVFYKVEEALSLAHVEIARPLKDLIDDALRIEYARDDAEAQAWATRLTRAVGQWRQTTYDEWVAAGRQS